ncbi:MAG: arginase family protein, partial [Gemmatimonadota bacterium]|nr:arginase family protein [Gemmatimonadota bacterium]
MSRYLGDDVWVGRGKGSGSEPEKDGAAAVIVPVPYDLTSSWRKGADQGPRALIEASAYVELYDIET